MELKDMILSTLAELDNEVQVEEKPQQLPPKPLPSQEAPAPAAAQPSQGEDKALHEERFLKNVRERILVLFEGFQSPNNQHIEAKVDLTLNFLEYLLASLDERLEILEKSTKK